jgi:hypothetical protein
VRLQENTGGISQVVVIVYDVDHSQIAFTHEAALESLLCPELMVSLRPKKPKYVILRIFLGPYPGRRGYSRRLLRGAVRPDYRSGQRSQLGETS